MKKIKTGILSLALIAGCAACGGPSSHHDAMADTDSAGMNTTDNRPPATNDIGMNPADGGATAVGMSGGSTAGGDTAGKSTSANSSMDTTRNLNTTGTTQSPNNNTNNPQGGGRR